MPKFAQSARLYTFVCHLYVAFRVTLFCNVHFAAGRLVFGSGLCYELQSYEFFFTYAIPACEFLRGIHFLCNFFTQNHITLTKLQI